MFIINKIHCKSPPNYSISESFNIVNSEFTKLKVEIYIYFKYGFLKAFSTFFVDSKIFRHRYHFRQGHYNIENKNFIIYIKYRNSNNRQ